MNATRGTSNHDLRYDQPHAAAQLAPMRVLMLGGTAAQQGRTSRAAQALGARLDVVDGESWPAVPGLYDAIVIGGAQAEMEDFAQVDAALDAGIAIVFDATSATVDALWSRYGTDARVTLLIEAEERELFAALGACQSERHMAVHADIETADHQLQLQRLQDEVARIARTLAKLNEPETRLLLRSADGMREPPSPFIEDHQLHAPTQGFAAGQPLQALGEGAGSSGPPLAARDVRRIIRMRRVRDQFFEAEIFADPAWDMLLDLYAARLEHARVAVSSLCIAAAVPATTALRWIKALSAAGLFVRRQDPHDGRRVFVALSDSATAAMHAYFAVVAQEGAVI